MLEEGIACHNNLKTDVVYDEYEGLAKVTARLNSICCTSFYGLIFLELSEDVQEGLCVAQKLRDTVLNWNK